MSIEEVLKVLEDLQSQGIEKVPYGLAFEMLKAFGAEMGQLFSYVLYNTEGAKNFLAVSFGSEPPGVGFDLILLKEGGSLDGYYDRRESIQITEAGSSLDKVAGQWFCTKNLSGRYCEYEKDDENDECRHCGEPWERK